MSIYDNASITREGVVLNESKIEEGCKGYDCNSESLVSKIVAKVNDLGQNVTITSQPTRLSYMISVLESVRFNVLTHYYVFVFQIFVF